MHAHAHPLTSRNPGNADQDNDQLILKTEKKKREYFENTFYFD